MNGINKLQEFNGTTVLVQLISRDKQKLSKDDDKRQFNKTLCAQYFVTFQETNLKARSH